MLNDRQITLIKPPEKGRKSYGDINGLSLRSYIDQSQKLEYSVSRQRS